MDESEIRNRIAELVREEHALRERRSADAIDPDEEQQRLRVVGEALDQCWDLLRRRQALRDAGLDPETARLRSTDVVEGYLE